MDLPFVSIVTPTYARSPYPLEEAIESFLRQDYAGKKEMVVFNTCTYQKLFCSHKDVRIINWPVRPKTLGECRNLCVEHSVGDLMMTLDDDDIMLPHYMSLCVNILIADNNDWVKVGGLVRMVDGKFKKIEGPACNQFLYKKSAWRKVGKYADQGCGEDRIFEERLVSKSKGKRYPRPNSESGYIYRWGSHGGRVKHASEDGEDGLASRLGQTTSSSSVSHAMKMFASGKLPKGVVELRPHWGADYNLQFNNWVKTK